MSEYVSIIMPTYNCGKYIKESIESVENQTFSDWKLIIVDDNSKDNTFDIVKSFNDERLVYIKNDKNMGAAVARNIALCNAKGKWIAFLDSDDLWHKNKLEKQIDFMEKNGYIFSYTEYEKINENDEKLNIYCSGPEVITKRKMYNYGYPGCLTVMYDRKQIGDIQIADIKKNNDYAIWLKVCKKANCHLLKENLALYRIRKVSISHDKFVKKFKSHYDLFHICDNRNGFVSMYLAIMNMFYGLLKKIKYENKY